MFLQLLALQQEKQRARVISLLSTIEDGIGRSMSEDTTKEVKDISSFNPTNVSHVLSSLARGLMWGVILFSAALWGTHRTIQIQCVLCGLVYLISHAGCRTWSWKHQTEWSKFFLDSNTRRTCCCSIHFWRKNREHLRCKFYVLKSKMQAIVIYKHL